MAVGQFPTIQTKHKPPDILLVSIDTLRADRLSVYGYARPTSPRLERLAREAVTFDRFYYNGGGTLPSHMTLLTSLHPPTHGIGPESLKALEPERRTLAELLGDAGYATAAFTDGGWMSARFGFDQGFDLYSESGGGLEATLPAALSWLASVPSSRPVLLFIHTYDVHSAWDRLPYDCPGDAELQFVELVPTSFDGCRGDLCASELLADINRRVRAGEARLDHELSEQELRFISDLYDGCIHWTDGKIGELFDGVARSGRWRNSIVTVLSDHGEEFGEHGQLAHDQGGYEELARIPWILKLPGSPLAGMRVAGLAAMVDVLPTLLELAGLVAPDEAQGRSLVRALSTGRTGRPDLHMYSVLRTESIKYFSDEQRLFDLLADPAETENLFAARPDQRTALERRVRQLIAADHAAAAAFAEASNASPAVQLSDEEIRSLRALGYLR